MKRREKRLQSGRQGAAAAAALVLSALLGGCAGLLGSAERIPSAIYLLEMPAAGPPQAPTATGRCRTIVVLPPVPAPGFASARMIYTVEQYRLGYFAHSRWAATLPRMVQPLLVRTLERADGFAAVLTSPSPVEVDLRLESEELAVRQVFGSSGSMVEMELRVRLVENAGRRLLSERVLAVAEPAEANPASGVAAANRAAARLLDEVTDMARAAVRMLPACDADT